MAEKLDTVDAVHEHDKEVETKVVKGNEAFNEAMIKEPPNPWTRAQLLIYAFSIVGFFCSTMNGYDGSLINNLLQNPAFKDYYNVENTGIWAGIITSMYQIGGVVALPFVGPAIDTWGRRIGMLIGALLIIIGTIIQGTSHGAGQFMGGRFLLGFGVSIAAAAGPMYVVEINHPAFRGVVGAMYNTLWFSGAIIASGSARGALNTGGDYSWRLITWLQALFSGLICIFCLLLPESPRWLYVNNKKEAAKKMLSKYHGNGNPDSPWVTLQLHEYEELLDMDGADKRWWDYRALFRNRAAVYRLCCNLAISIFGQWAGNAVLSYFLGAVLDTCGYTDAISQANITLINSCQQFLCAIFGAFLVDRVGRRPLLLFSFTGCCVVWLGMTIASAEFANSGGGKNPDGSTKTGPGIDTNASKAALAMIFIFGSIYSVGITPLQALYPVEVLSFEMRAKGMAFSSLAVNVAGLLNQFAWPVAMENIGWKTYIVFTVQDCVQALIIWLYIPETKGRTLEELDEIFAAKNPVKASTQKKAIAVTQHGDIVNVQEV
ncbi:putative lactose permease protein [Phaeoacremonium minimum UCRPA7]|uniref:Putative lactose permease protein n=1 Tax=Phaeoacremonium minimum (strain UCR-PA7) TaxID=1286976 RepID=R8B9A5_PHAM7|nr:putative lactose permease protein [Phaeoacremonium minimum UCRPA7]EON95871.1 putative lactose permease protein [Phaeoacremonium minimum UCRPA7]